MIPSSSFALRFLSTLKPFNSIVHRHATSQRVLLVLPCLSIQRNVHPQPHARHHLRHLHSNSNLLSYPHELSSGLSGRGFYVNSTGSSKQSPLTHPKSTSSQLINNTLLSKICNSRSVFNVINKRLFLEQIQVTPEEKKSFEQLEGVRVEKFKQTLNYVMLIFLPIAFYFPSETVNYYGDLAFAALIPTHGYIGIRTVLKDYLPESVFPFFSLGFFIVTLIAVYGLIQLKLKEDGLSGIIKLLWTASRTDEEDLDDEGEGDPVSPPPRK